MGVNLGASPDGDRAGGPTDLSRFASQPKALIPCAHGVKREAAWCEPCFRNEQRTRWGYSPWDFCDYLGRVSG